MEGEEAGVSARFRYPVCCFSNFFARAGERLEAAHFLVTFPETSSVGN